MCASTAETPKRAHAVLTDLAHIAFGILTVLAAVYVHPVVSAIMFSTFIIMNLMRSGISKMKAMKTSVNTA